MEDKNKAKAIDLAVASIEKEYGKGSIMRLKEGQTLTPDTGGRPEREHRPRHRARHRRLPARAHHGDLRPGVERQDDAHPPRDRAGAEARRRRGVHRRGARARPDVRAQARREDGRAARLAAGLRRAGARDRRHARPLGRGRLVIVRLGRGARAEGGDRGGHGGQPRRDAGAAHVAGAPQAHGDGRALQLPARLHQPDPHEDRRHVRLSGDDDGRQRAQVLRDHPPRHPPHRRDQGGRGRDDAGKDPPSSATGRA